MLVEEAEDLLGASVDRTRVIGVANLEVLVGHPQGFHLRGPGSNAVDRHGLVRHAVDQDHGNVFDAFQNIRLMLRRNLAC